MKTSMNIYPFAQLLLHSAESLGRRRALLLSFDRGKLNGTDRTSFAGEFSLTRGGLVLLKIMFDAIVWAIVCATSLVENISRTSMAMQIL